MATSPVNRQRFARFVKRALDDARDRNMNDDAIEKATGVGASTFHRWQRGDFATAPDLDKIRAFCAGLDVPVAPAMVALGLVEGRDDPAPEPTMDPEVRRISRLLADPNVSSEDKAAIRRMLSLIGPGRGR